MGSLRLILFGPPGSGKGTQSQYISEHYGIPQISTGDMLRQVSGTTSALGVQIKSLMNSGSLVPDKLIIDLVRTRIQYPDCAKGFILDGFPRTLTQAQALSESDIKIDKIIELQVMVDEIIQRLAGRWIHVPSGRVYHEIFQPPQRPKLDDVTHEPLVQRLDDKEDTVRKRLSIYQIQTQPAAHYYMRLAASGSVNAPHYKMINGAQPPLKVCEDIFNYLNEL